MGSLRCTPDLRCFDRRIWEPPQHFQKVTGYAGGLQSARMNPNSEPTYISPRQLADKWGFHEESIRRMIREGKLRAVRLGNRLRVSLKEVRAFEAANRVSVKEGNTAA